MLVLRCVCVCVYNKFKGVFDGRAGAMKHVECEGKHDCESTSDIKARNAICERVLATILHVRSATVTSMRSVKQQLKQQQQK